jgi:hypothetical protein
LDASGLSAAFIRQLGSYSVLISTASIRALDGYLNSLGGDMDYKLIRSALLLLFFSFFSPVTAQEYIDEDEAPLLFAKVFCLFQQNEPKWEAEGYGLSVVSAKGFIIRLISREGRAYVSADIFPSETAAKEALMSLIELRRRAPKDEAVFPPPERFTISELKDFGQEGYLLTSDRRSGTWIIFRKGHYLVDIMGQPEGTAKGFAKHVANFLAPSNNSLNRTRN